MRNEFADVLEAAWAPRPPKARVDADPGEKTRPRQNVVAPPRTVTVGVTVTWSERVR